jgi:hypothetical protein
MNVEHFRRILFHQIIMRHPADFKMISLKTKAEKKRDFHNRLKSFDLILCH